MIEKCIYCNRGQEDGIKLSESDIIPDALTNKKIINRRVCKIDHNNKFSDMFESAVINQFAYLRNRLGILNKGKKVPSYKSVITIDNLVLEKKINSPRDFLNEKIVSGQEGINKVKFGSLEQINKIKNIDNYRIKKININDSKITEELILDCSIFYSNEMLRLVSKVGYEWYCKKHKINGVNNNYKDIIEFILTSDSKLSIVEIVTDDYLHEIFEKNLGLGSHVLCEYTTKTGDTYIIFSFFGLVIYKVLIEKKYNCSYVNPIELYGIRYDGTEVIEKLHLNSDDLFDSEPSKLVISNSCNKISQRYQRILQTELLTISNLSSTVSMINNIINTNIDDKLYNELIGYQERKKIHTLYCLYHLGKNLYAINYENNFEQILATIFQTNGIRMQREEFISFLEEKYYDDDFISTIKLGSLCFSKLKERQS